jgi:hypothetical protein
VDERETNKVNRAIRRCLTHCRQSPAPIVSLAEFLDDLRADPAWREAEIHMVEVAVRRILAQLVNTREVHRSG